MFNGLKFRIPAINVGLAFISVTAMAFLSWHTAQSGLADAAKDRLQFAATARKSSVELIFDRSRSDLSYLAGNAAVSSNFSDLAENLDPASNDYAKVVEAFTSPPTVEDRVRLDGHEQGTMYGRRHVKLHEAVRKLLGNPGYADVLLIDEKSRIIYTATKSGDFTHSLDESAYRDTGLAALIDRMSKAGSDETLFADFAPYPIGNSPSAFLAKAMTRRANAAMGTAQADVRIGYIVLRLEPGLLATLGQRDGLGATGQVFALGNDGLLRSQPPLAGQPMTGHPMDGFGAVKDKLEYGGSFDYTGTDQVERIAASAPFSIMGARWTLVAEQSAVEALHAVSSLTRTLVWTSLIVVALTVVLGILSARSIVTPILALAQRMQRLSAGLIDEAIHEQGRHDEIGLMARAVQIFKDNALALRESQKEASERKLAQDEDRRRNEAVRAKAAEELDEVVGAIAHGLEQLSAGDLTCQILASFSPDYEKLRTDFNAAITQLRDTMRLVAGNTESMRAGTGEISHTSADLARRTAQQASSLEQVANSLSQVTATVRMTAENAERARAAVALAKGEAEQSGQVVHDAVAAMGAIAKSSSQINQVIIVIDEIAFQTSLLALNAGVEAARAGEAGRGFAVVASEVRGLAQRSAEAAKEIKALIAVSTGHVASGVALVDQTGRALTRIVTQVIEANGVVAAIAASAKEQASGLAEVDAAMSQMDQVTQQNAAMVEEATEANQALAGEADGLSTLVGRFRMDDLLAGATPGRAPASSVSRAEVRSSRFERTMLRPSVQQAHAEDWSA